MRGMTGEEGMKRIKRDWVSLMYRTLKPTRRVGGGKEESKNGRGKGTNPEEPDSGGGITQKGGGGRDQK